MNRHDEHYLNKGLEPYDIMKSFGILSEYQLGAAIKYIHRAVFNSKESRRKNIDKAISSLIDLREDLPDETG